MKRILVFLCFLFPLATSAGPRLALTFDDGFDPVSEPAAVAWNAALLDALRRENVHSMLFVAGKRVDSDLGMALVREWGRAGHWIGNHTYSHAYLPAKAVTTESFTADIQRNEYLLEALPSWQKRFRFPYLKEGSEAAERDAVRAWLGLRGYSIGSVSIDTSDWYYAGRYREWKTKYPHADEDAFRDIYLAHLWDRANYYEGLSQQLLSRSVPHVMLLHTTALNARFLADIIHMFRARGWDFVTPDVAWRDPVYERRPDVLPAGESLLWAIARERGAEGLRYPAEDAEYEKAALDAAGF